MIEKYGWLFMILYILILVGVFVWYCIATFTMLLVSL